MASGSGHGGRIHCGRVSGERLTAPIVAYAWPVNQSATCTGTPARDPVTGTLAAGEMDYLFLFSSDKTSLKSIFVPQLH